MQAYPLVSKGWKVWADAVREATREERRRVMRSKKTLSDVSGERYILAQTEAHYAKRWL